ncbi:reticulon-4-like isoform X1 [Cheilinus undulatus]|uniref:reticulon-4-like isoform X1 n=1 Tax=Cheilinus undulatus TaxID=241271 RepID=UPI001BD3CBB3|nr:reticulon-4-like isoform X1 [Cheilinus undulatus]
MADSMENDVSSTTPLFTEGVHHYEAEPDPELDQPKQDLFSVDDIVDLVGGAQDALERHIAEDSAPHEFTESAIAAPEEPETIPEPVPAPEPEPVSVPEVIEPEPEPEPESVIPDSTTTSFVPETPLIVEEPEVVAPKAEPESTKIVPEPQAAPEPEPALQSDALPAAEPRKAAPAPAEAAEQPAVKEEPSAPASYVPSPSKAQPHPLMQFPTALGQKGDSPAPISPISPLHSPDSLEELSLTESPNQPPTSGYAAPLGSFSTEPPTTHSKDMPWVGEEGDTGTGRSKNKEDLLDPLAGPYLSLGKDPGPHNPCEDSGVSFSPEERLISSDRSSTGPSPVNPQMKVPESHIASSNPTEHWDSPFLASQDNSKVSMDTFSKDTAPIGSSRYESDLLGNQSDEDDDLMYEVKKNNNPFEGFSPLADSGYSHFGDSKSDSRASKMSESPTPDLVQYGQTESQDAPPSFLDEGKSFETGKMAADSLMQSVNQFSSGLKDDDEEEEEDSALPPSLPDILKSSPLNPDKIDSGSSEGSPEEQSPILERRMMESPNPPINLSANNPFAFDAKVSLLKEMTEEMEVRAADKAKVEDDKSFGAFDLVKEAEETTPTKVKEEVPVKIEQKDWFSSHDSPKMKEKFEPLDFQSKKTTAEDSDSESPTADSLSPVLEAMAKNPASFQVETQKKDVTMEEPEVAEEVSEHEVSSEEFEFIERPPRGVIDEFLEALDTSKFASSKPSEIPMDDDDLSFGQKNVAPVSASKAAPKVEEESQSQSSYRLLTQASPQKSKAELEKLDIQQPPPQVPLIHSPVHKPEEGAAKKTTEGGKLLKMPNLSVRAVVDLLYWRDVKTTGVVFGASMLLLLSLMVCSIVSVCSYIGLALLSVTICFRIYKGILQAIQKSDEGHPFKQFLDQEVALSEDMVHKYSDIILAKLNKTISELRRLFLVEDLVDSIKFAVLMWILTYVGALFNGLTILILALIGAFSCPIIYEKHQTQIDHYLALVNNQVKDVVGKIQAKVPGMKRKTE